MSIFLATCNTQKNHLDKHWPTGRVKNVNSHYGGWEPQNKENHLCSLPEV